MTTAILLMGATAQTDIRYKTGFLALGELVLLCKGKKCFLMVPQLEFGRAVQCVKNAEVLTPEMLGNKGKNRHPVVRLLNRERIKSVQICPGFTYDAALMLQKAGIRLQLATGPLFPEREIKKNSEIKMIRESQQTAVIAMRSAIAVIAGSVIGHDGLLRYQKKVLTSEMIHSLIGKIFLEHNCGGDGIIASCGIQAAEPHERGYGPLRANQPIVLDIFPRHLQHGYWGDITRTVVRGKASPAIREMYNTVRLAHSIALSMVKPGAKCSRIHQAVVDEIEKHGFVTRQINGRPEGFFHGTGHGVGLAIHEAPGVRKESTTRLRKGHIITIEPGLYYPEIGGVRVEDTVEVTSTGWRYLAPCEKRFEI